jgi:hypothetical protein
MCCKFTVTAKLISCNTFGIFPRIKYRQGYEYSPVFLVPVFLRISSLVFPFQARIVSFATMRAASQIRHIGLENLKNYGNSFSNWRAQKRCADIDIAPLNS